MVKVASTLSPMRRSSENHRAEQDGRDLSVLAITSELPWPLNTGGHLRTFHLLRALAARFRVRLVCGATAAQGEAIAALEQHGIRVRAAFHSGRHGVREFLRASGAALRGEPYVLYQRHNRRCVRTLIRQELERERPEVLYLDHLDAAVFFPTASPVPTVVDMHNVYSTLVRREAAARGRLLRAYLTREARLLQRMEARTATLADTLLAVSEPEANYFRELGPRPVHVIPNGVDCAAYETLPAGHRTGPPIILYVGTMSWAPNAGAACFLAREVLPKVRGRFPVARLRIIGKDPSSEVQALGNLAGVEITGTVPSMVPHLREAHVLAVPLEAGGGTRLKILEAFAAGLPVVSTKVGCEGLRVTEDEHLLVAPRDAFADAILTLLSNQTLGDYLAQQARILAHESYDWKALGRSAADLVALAARSRRGVKADPLTTKELACPK